MKKYLLSAAFLCISFVFALTTSAQKDSSGIYKTTNDFIAKKLSLVINCKTENHKIKINDIFSQDHITVVHDGKSYDFKKSDIYGYKLCNGETFRFSGNKDYLVMNPNEVILLYKVEVLQTKAQSTKVYTYYFSKDAASSLQDLTMANLKAAFPTNHKFHDELDANFKSDKDLTAYDSFHKMYKVDHILMMSEK
jgi:diadenosine tetraphosphate (Ap4A) HIT family hydrolase